ISPISFIFVKFLVGVMATGPGAWWEWESGRPLVWSPGLGAAILSVAPLLSLAAYFMYTYAQCVVGAGQARLATPDRPLFGALLGEQLHLFRLAGMALILAGIVIAVMAGLARRADR